MRLLYLYLYFYDVLCKVGHAVAQWLRHCPINRKVAGTIPDVVL
jgi:hypothetical protein